ncbi:transporter substrate-binding domain-containing protein [Shewanella sp. VB17]|uniref:substrate-binding periplasmic protein n=1 Tax=Shewanella sp. VB17 TaxID=2739432 RepID=UPI00156501C5|nr:transporter substrate-binding domain-containing protein [Shewanella sp. VB17]NRD75245.1 transporter substrate-binding domain-containing protein [Shewanella sp. VB17]
MQFRLILTLTLFTVLLFDATLSAGSEIEELKIGTMDLPPYGWIDENGEKKGILYDMHQELGIRYGSSFQNSILPFSRMLYLLRIGRIDLISSQGHKAALEVGEKLSIQHKVKVIAVTKKGSNIHTIEDLTGKSLLYHKSASYPKLEGLPGHIERVESYQHMIKMLTSRVFYDAAIFSEPAYYYWLNIEGFSKNDFGDVIVIQDNIEQWIFVRKNLPLAIKIKLKTLVEEMNHEQRYQQLVDKLIKQTEDKVHF